MVPKESGFNQSETASGKCSMVKLYKGSILVITEAQFAIQSQVMQPNCMERIHACGCNNNAILSDRAIFTFPTVTVCRPR